MMVAQQLYEGVEIGDGGPVGLITYMRTDSPAGGRRGPGRGPRASSRPGTARRRCPTGRRSTGPASRPRRPTRPSGPRCSISRPSELARHLSRDQLALYRLIWERFLASQMRPALYDTLTVDVTAGPYLFRALGSQLRAPGFMAVYIEAPDESAAPVAPEDVEAEVSGMPPLEVGQRLGSGPARAEAALHPAAAPLHRGLPGEGAGGEGDRPARPPTPRS